VKSLLLGLALCGAALGTCGGNTYNIAPSGQTYTTWIAAFTQFLSDCPQGPSTTATASSGASSMTVALATGITTGMAVAGTGIAVGPTVVTSVSGTTIGLSLPTTASLSATAVNFGPAVTSTVTFHVFAGTYTAYTGGNHTMFPFSPQFVVCCTYNQIGTTATNRVVITLDSGVVLDGTSLTSLGLYTDQGHVTINGGEFKANSGYGIQLDVGANDIVINNSYIHDGGSQGLRSNATNLTVSGVTILRPNNEGAALLGNNCLVTNTTISNNVAFNDGLYIGGSGCIVHDNVFHDNARANLNFDSANVTSGLAYNNISWNSSFEFEANTGATGVIFYNNIGGGTTLINTYNVDNGSCADFYNNIAWGTVGNGESSAMFGLTCPGGMTGHVINNVAYVASGANGLVLASGATNIVTDYNDFYLLPGGNFAHVAGAAVYTLSQWQNFYGQDAHSFNANPLWNNLGGTTAADYKVSAGSPLLNAGLSEAGIFTTDIFGTSRPQGAAWDVGPYEYIPTAAGSWLFLGFGLYRLP
jgi:parallel beta helix pectate lyase-like protein